MTGRKLIELEQLAALIEDSLSACAGWTVPCPVIHVTAQLPARANWHVESSGLDRCMAEAIDSLQRRFNVRVLKGAGQDVRPSRSRLALP